MHTEIKSRAVTRSRSTSSFRISWNAAGATAALALAVGVTLAAATPTFWTVSTQADFLKGDVEDLSIDSDGRVFLGPTTALVAETAAPFIWTMVAGADGTLWAGTGNEGKVLKIGKDGKAATFFDAAELEVHAIAAAPNNGLYVATSPDGKIYHVAADGTSKVLFDPEDKYIWALAVDRTGNLFAATGDKGVIYKITPAGQGTRFYKTSATNVVSLAFTKSGDLLAGTESPGRIFRIDANGKAFVLLDSPFKEIHALRVADDGTLYAAAVSGAVSTSEDRSIDRTPPETPRTGAATVSAEVTSISVVDTPAPPISTPIISGVSRRSNRGAIYRIKPDGLWDTFWETGEDSPFDMLIDADGSLLVGTGPEGKLFRLAGDPARATLLSRATARQITALLRDPSRRIIGATSNPGKLFALSTNAATRGSYESDVRDAGTVATWGVIRWRVTARPGQVQVFTRSGNTATPDETWSAWSKAYTSADGEQIASPNARYLQWRTVLTADGAASPTLTSVTAAYLPRNLRPEVASITIHPPGVVFQRPFSTGDMEIAGFEDNTSDGRPPAQTQTAAGGPSPPVPPLGRRIYQKGLQTIVWKAEDDNADRLQYDVSYRREGETAWKVLKRGLWDAIFVWDTTSVPDGTYLVRISASDGPSNAPATALTGEMESVSFDIDNTPPRIETQTAVKAGSRSTIAFTVRDDQSAVQRVEYSLDASRWRMVYPKDGIPDSRREEFEVAIDEAEVGRSVIIRATDAMNNVATAVAPLQR
ncbi:MAG TPA: SMP-30/gluconolactonase/LRE family protein [Vicinamibacterales bacterium]|nr:SMP-30/gluconolactonase/LRE family protein [Vicinamibacterales bacterium]